MTGPAGVSRRSVLRALAAAPLAAAAVSCAGPDDRAVYRLATAEPGGFFSEFGALLADVIASSDLPVLVRPETSTGSVENLERLRLGSADLALGLADSLMAARAPVVALGRVYENYMQVAVPAGSPVRRVADLRGRRISTGLSSGTRFAAERILAAAGLTTQDVVVTPVPVLGVLDALTDGTVEAAFFLGGVPHPPADPVGKRAPAGGIRLIDLAEVLPTLRARHGPVYQTAVLRPGLYGAGGPVTTVGLPSVLLARPGLPDDVAAIVVDVLRTRSDALVPAGALGAQYLDARSLIYTFGVPLHPGAARAYREGHG